MNETNLEYISIIELDSKKARKKRLQEFSRNFLKV